MLRDLWAYRRRAVTIAALVLVALLGGGVIVAATLGAGGRHRVVTPSSASRSTTAVVKPTSVPSASGYDHGPWDAVSAVSPDTSEAFPAVPATDRTQPDLFAQAFGTELLTRDYRRSSRDELLGWAASESAPLSVQQVPLTAADRAKALLVSLTSTAWDNSTATLVPPGADWTSLAEQDAYTTVSNVTVQSVPGFPPANTTFTDPRTLDRLFSANVTLHTKFGGNSVSSRTSVAFEVVLGTSAFHGRVFGAAMTQHYVTRKYVP